MCILHGSVGRRILKSKQAWKKKKDGTYGYITSKKVLYECVRSTNLKQPTTQSSGEKPCISEPILAQQLGVGTDNIVGESVGLEGRDSDCGNKQDKSESSIPDDGLR